MIVSLISDYLNYLEVERALSPNTIEAYRRDIFAFFEYALKTYNIENIEDIRRTHLSA